MTPVDVRHAHSILAHDDADKATIEIGKHVYIWYFAIGSMINPISIYLRDLTPLVSYPARCPRYRLVFREPNGMADIDSCQETEFDGVVHLLPHEQMMRLDQVEHMYCRRLVTIVDYDERSHLVYVYKMNAHGERERSERLPTERYLDIIVKGCEHFGVRSLHIDRLKHHQAVVPRKSPTDLETIHGVPDDVYYTPDELAKRNGNDPLFPLWISVNGKILEHTGLPPVECPDYDNHKRLHDFIRSYFAGREVTRAISRTWYEPMHQLPLKDDDLCHEHRTYAEDMCVSWRFNASEGQGESYWKPIGRLRSTSPSKQI